MGSNQITLRLVVPSVLRDDAEKQTMIDALTGMGCDRLLAHPWNLKNEEMERKFTRRCTNQWDKTLRRDP